MKEEIGQHMLLYRVCEKSILNLDLISILLDNCDVNINTIVTQLASVLPDVPLKPTDNFHISLTKTVVLRHHWIEPFVESVKERISCVRR